MVARCWAIISDTLEDLCCTPFHKKLQRYPDHDHNTNFVFLVGTISTYWKFAFFCHWELNKWTIPVHNWLRSMAGALVDSEWWRVCLWTYRALDLHILLSGASNCLGIFGVYASINFQKLVYIYFYFLEFSVLNKHIFLEMRWCFDSCLTAISTQNSYQSDEWDFHNSLVPSHLSWRRAAILAASPICFLDTSQVETMTLQQIMLVSSL